MNLTIRDLTPQDLMEIDPSGEGRRHLMRMVAGQPTPVPPIFADLSRDEWRAIGMTLVTPLDTPKYHPLYEEELHYFESKWGPQGASIDLKQVKEMLLRYYARVPAHPLHSARLTRGRDYFIKCIRDEVTTHGYPSLSIRVKHEHTAGGLPYCIPKGTWSAETAGMSNWRHVQPDLPGQRNMRQSPRIVHMDSVQNVRYVEKPLTAVRNWLKGVFPNWFSAWLNPRSVLQPTIYRMLQHPKLRAYGFDYEKLDTYYSWALVEEYILPVYEVLLPPAEFMHFAAFIEESFSQPVFMGDTMWEGLHNLFSGQNPTNDFETILDIELMLALLLDHDLIGDMWSGKIFLAALGDDVIALDTTGHLDGWVIDEYAAVADEVNLVLSSEKCTAQSRRVTFLRRSYGLGYPTAPGETGYYQPGAYPLALCMNSIINPERHSDGPQASWTALCQRCDNLYGHPRYVPLVEKLAAHIKRRGYKFPGFAPVEQDWWERLYGEAWTPDTSITVRHMRRLGIITQ